MLFEEENYLYKNVPKVFNFNSGEVSVDLVFYSGLVCGNRFRFIKFREKMGGKNNLTLSLEVFSEKFPFLKSKNLNFTIKKI